MSLVIDMILAATIWLPTMHKEWPVAHPVIPCTFNAYSCSSFVTQPQAQTVFDYCVERGFGDVHRLDGDNDGLACESLPGGFRVIR